jgi:hypothetical protein
VLDPLYDAVQGKVNFVAVNGDARGIDQSPETQADVIDFRAKVRRLTIPSRSIRTSTSRTSICKPVSRPSSSSAKTERSSRLNDGELPSKNIAAALEAAIAGQPVKPDFGVKQPPAGS